MNKQDHIIFEAQGCRYESYPEIEQQIKRLMFAVHKPDTIVKCIDYDTHLLLDELPLNVLFSEVTHK